MPLRPNIAGFRLATFRSLTAGEVDPEHVEDILADVALRLAEADDEHVRPILDNVRYILTRKLVPGAVEKEDSSLVNAVIALATTGQQLEWVDDDSWHPGFVDFASRFPPAPCDVHGCHEPAASGAEMRTLVHWALLQRPVFGRPQGSWWSTYGYLSHTEVSRLLTYHRHHPSLGDHGPQVASGFFALLQHLHDAGLDYWFHCS